MSENKSTHVSNGTNTATELEKREYLCELSFKNIDVRELYETMQVPSYSRYEFRMATYIIMWARKNGVKYNLDAKGNVYLTKGALNDGEYYPCLTSHMDTVQNDAKPYALIGAELPIKTRLVNHKGDVQHELYIEGQGIGADDKLGVYICLQLIKKFDKIKAAFFVEEEIGMLGSDQMDVSFFNDVAYVIGWDSPDLLRAAWKCSGTRLFSYDFYVNKLSPIVKRWGFVDDDFHSEPFTDIVNIKQKTLLMCMNFGNGGYNAHSNNEYLVVEDVNHAVGMGEDIIKTLGNKEVYKDANDIYKYNSEDDTKLSKLFGYHYTYSTYASSNSGSSSTAKVVPMSNNSSTNKDDDKFDVKTVKYIVETYDKYVNNVKDDVSKVCDDIINKLKLAGVDLINLDIDIKESILESFNKEINF